jgi:hypothetical protein
MPCLLALLALAFPRVVIILLWLFTNFFRGFYHEMLIPILGFIFLPLTLIVYTYFRAEHAHLTSIQLIILVVAVVIDLGLVGGGSYGRRRAG